MPAARVDALHSDLYQPRTGSNGDATSQPGAANCTPRNGAHPSICAMRSAIDRSISVVRRRGGPGFANADRSCRCQGHTVLACRAAVRLRRGSGDPAPSLPGEHTTESQFGEVCAGGRVASSSSSRKSRSRTRWARAGSTSPIERQAGSSSWTGQTMASPSSSARRP